jgi:hypothetical protein
VQNGLLESLGALTVSGYAIIAAIIGSGLLSVTASLWIGVRYAQLEEDLRQHGGERPFSHPVLNRILEDARAGGASSGERRSFEAIVENRFRSDLGPLLLGERFVRSAIGLAIILGLVGTFYGLTLSIGKLNTLVSGDSETGGDIAESMIRGLTDTLAGMSVAFSTSLFGIGVAIVLTVFGIFCNVTDRRTDLMITMEAHLHNILRAPEPGGHVETVYTEQLQRVVDNFGASAAGLGDVVRQFQAALQGFATTTRDFREFNLHLKDNVQRMSLSFGDLSETLKTRTAAIASGEQR